MFYEAEGEFGDLGIFQLLDPPMAKLCLISLLVSTELLILDAWWPNSISHGWTKELLSQPYASSLICATLSGF